MADNQDLNPGNNGAPKGPQGNFIPVGSGETFDLADSGESVNAAQNSAPLPIAPSNGAPNQNTAFTRAASVDIEAGKDLSKYSIRKQRRRAFNPFRGHAASHNKALDEARATYSAARTGLIVGLIAAAGVPLAVVTASAILPIGGIAILASIGAGVAVAGYSLAVERKRNLRVDACLLQALDHIRGDVDVSIKAKRRLLQLPHYKKLYGDNGAGLEAILQRHPEMRVKGQYQRTGDADHYAANLEDNRRKLGDEMDQNRSAADTNIAAHKKQADATRDTRDGQRGARRVEGGGRGAR